MKVKRKESVEPMKTVWKFPLAPDSVEGESFQMLINVPVGAKPLCIMNQNGEIFLWAEVDTGAAVSREVLSVYCVGTGHGKVPEGKEYFGSVIQDCFVWHFYI